MWADGSGLDSPASVVSASGNQAYPTLSKPGPGSDLYVLHTDHASGSPDLYGQRYVPRLVNFTATPDNGYVPLSVQFHDRSTISPFDTRQWDFGDGVTSTLSDPVHVYPQRLIFYRNQALLLFMRRATPPDQGRRSGGDLRAKLDQLAR